MKRHFLMVDAAVLPEVFLKVLKAKELLASGEARNISAATRAVDLSRSAFYKYKDCIFDARSTQQIITVLATLLDENGALQALLGGISAAGGSVVTINQATPENGAAKVEVTVRTDTLRVSIEEMLAQLAQVDPETAARLHPNDHKRIVRALEVFRSTGRTLSQHDRETRALPPRYDALTIGLTFRERADLWARIDQRVDQMARDGLEAEVRGLLSSGLPRTCTAMQAIGYKEFVAAVDGQISWREAEELVKLRSRQYAKRQLTWLRRNQDIHWILWEKERDFARALQISTKILSDAGVC